MPRVWMDVEVEVDVTAALDHLDPDQFQELGLAKVDRADWEKVGAAVRANDMNEVLRLVSELAFDQVGITLPPPRIPTQQPMFAAEAVRT